MTLDEIDYLERAMTRQYAKWTPCDARALCRMAARYLWLREFGINDPALAPHGLAHEELDAAIDAALKGVE